MPLPLLAAAAIPLFKTVLADAAMEKATEVAGDALQKGSQLASGGDKSTPQSPGVSDSSSNLKTSAGV